MGTYIHTHTHTHTRAEENEFKKVKEITKKSGRGILKTDETKHKLERERERERVNSFHTSRDAHTHTNR